MVENLFLVNESILEEINDSNFVGGDFWSDLMKLSPISNAMGNKGAVCTGTIECQNNCR